MRNRENETDNKEANNCDWNELPTEILYIILNYLSFKDIYSCFLVCKAWANETKAPIMISDFLKKDPAIKADIHKNTLILKQQMPIKFINHDIGQNSVRVNTIEHTIELNFFGKTYKIQVEKNKQSLLQECLSKNTIEKINQISPGLIPEDSSKKITYQEGFGPFI